MQDVLHHNFSCNKIPNFTSLKLYSKWVTLSKARVSVQVNIVEQNTF